MYKSIKIIIFIFIISVLILKINIKILIKYLNFHILITLLFAQPFMFLSLSMITTRYAILTWTPPTPFWLTLKAIALSIGFNTVLPSRISEFIKPIYLNARIDIPISAGCAAVFLERMLDLIILGTLAILGMALLTNLNTTFIIVLMIFAVLIVLSLPYFEPFYLKILAKLPIRIIRNFSQDFLTYASTKTKQSSFYKAFLYGLLGWGFSFMGMFTFLNLAGDISISLKDCLGVFLAIIIGGAIPALPGGFGTYEAAAVFALKKLGYTTEAALVLAIFLHLGQITISVLISLGIIITEKINITEFFKKINTLSSHESN